MSPILTASTLDVSTSGRPKRPVLESGAMTGRLVWIMGVTTLRPPDGSVESVVSGCGVLGITCA